jgi:hypothetical protein
VILATVKNMKPLQPLMSNKCYTPESPVLWAFLKFKMPKKAVFCYDSATGSGGPVPVSVFPLPAFRARVAWRLPLSHRGACPGAKQKPARPAVQVKIHAARHRTGQHDAVRTQADGGFQA